MSETWNEVRGQSLTGPTDVDGNHYIDCRFNEVQLRYGGGGLPNFENCTFDGVSWYFHGAALRTIQLLQLQNMQGENQAFMNDMFRPGNLLGE